MTGPSRRSERARLSSEQAGDQAVYGRHSVFELLRHGGRRADEVAVLAGGRGPLQEIVSLARRAGVKVSFRTREQLTAMAGSPHHQGVVARVAAAEYLDLDALLQIPSLRGEPPFFLALDQIQDPRNLGAVLRTADALGVHGVVVTKYRSAGLTDAAARVAVGALEFVKVAREPNLVVALEVMKSKGIWTYGAVIGGSKPPWDVDLTAPLCLVLGGEGEGLRRLVESTCDGVVTIPMGGHVGSLNIGAAAAVLCYEVVRQRAGRTKSVDLRRDGK
jgi:23S rRNA (guanosine2251-2'-O)-methyltransferase